MQTENIVKVAAVLKMYCENNQRMKLNSMHYGIQNVKKEKNKVDYERRNRQIIQIMHHLLQMQHYLTILFFFLIIYTFMNE